MSSTISSRLIDLTYEACLKSFWRKRALRRFLRTCSVSDGFLSTWSEDETKRDFLDRLFQQLQKTENGKLVISRMAVGLSEQATFPDLRGWEDSQQKIGEAQRSVKELRAYLEQQSEVATVANNRREVQRRAKKQSEVIQRSIADRKELQDRLEELQPRVGTQPGGYAFQDWFYEFLDYFEVTNRRPYHSSGRQIDGSLTHDGTTYLVELKFTGSQIEPIHIDSLKSKVTDKADNTMGIFVSISGYSEVAKQTASGAGTTLLLLDHGHIYLSFQGALGIGDVISRVRRHASQTGEAYLSAARFSD